MESKVWLLVKWLSLCLREGNSCVFSVLRCSKTCTAVGLIILPYFLSLKSFTWGQKTLKKPDFTAKYILCWQRGAHSCQCLQCNVTIESMRRGQQNDKTRDHIITKSHLLWCDSLCFLFFFLGWWGGVPNLF